MNQLTCAVASWQATRYDEMIRLVVSDEADAYVRTKLEVTNAADNVLIVWVIEMAVEYFLRKCERAVEPVHN